MKKIKFYPLLLMLGLFFVAGCTTNDNVTDTTPDSSEQREQTGLSEELETSTAPVPVEQPQATEDEEPFAYLDTAAAAALPEAWMAYPGSMVEIDWVARGMSTKPSWMLVAPAGTTREQVIKHYEQLAETRDDFETVQVWHGVTGTWDWDGQEIMIETDFHYEQPDYVQITFAFQ